MLSKPITERLQWFERLAEQHIVTQRIVDTTLAEKNIYWDILRTDLIHPVCSGNKFFKLKYYLLDAIQKKHTRIITYGGAWSNHIAATAFAAEYCGLKSLGIVRGEKPALMSETLVAAAREGMELQFMAREEFDEYAMKTSENPHGYVIPQGGYGKLGARGASEMIRFIKEDYTHICCACGTGTMLAGLISAFSGSFTHGKKHPRFIGIPIVKDPDLRQHVENLMQPGDSAPFSLVNDYQFGGYAKKTAALIAFMNSFYIRHQVPTDFVYTAKLMYALDDMLHSGFFPAGSRILAIHSGGLQGNKSLKKGTLCY